MAKGEQHTNAKPVYMNPCWLPTQAYKSEYQAFLPYLTILSVCASIQSELGQPVLLLG